MIKLKSEKKQEHPIIVCWKLNTPNNLGSILRLGDNMACEKVLFVDENPSFKARNIKKTLSNPQATKKKGALFKKYTVETKTVKKGHMTKNLDLAVFSGKKNNLLGPIVSDDDYYVIEILRFNRVGTIKGLEEVYDEIYQRLLKEKEGVLFQAVLDSLYTASTVFITSNIRNQQ